MSNMNSARERARDVQRKSDLKSIQTALRLYYNDASAFPAVLPAWGSEWKVGTTVYMNKLPNDPLPGVNYRYTYINDDSYTLDACLENKSDDKGQTAGSWCASGWMYEVKP